MSSRCKHLLREHRDEAGIFLAALVVSLSLLFSVSSFVHRQGRDIYTDIVASQKDSKEYIELGENLRTGQGYIRVTSEQRKFEIFRVPGYPFFLSLLGRISPHPLSIPVVHAILLALTCVGIYLIGKKILSRPLGILAALGYLLMPSAHHLSLLALSETLFQFVFIYWVYLVLAWVQAETLTYRSSILIGAVAGSLVLLRPSALFLFPFTIGIIGLVHISTKHLRTYEQFFYWIKKTIPALLIFCAITGIWVVRNQRKANFTGVSSISSYNIFYYNLADFDAVRLGITRTQALDQNLAQIGLTQATAYKNDPDAIKRMGQFNKTHLRQFGLAYTQFHFKKIALFFLQSDAKSFYTFLHTTVLQRGEYTDPPLTRFFTSGDWKGLVTTIFKNPREILFLFERMGWAFLILLSVTGLFLAPPERKLWTLLQFGLALYFALITGPVLMSRYRMPAAPLLLVLSLMTLQLFWQGLGKRKLAKIKGF